MKRFLTLIVAICAFLAASAQHPMVTLSHNGELSFFSNVGAFQAAVDSAKNGDTLYLSEGNFVIDGGAITITKRLSIVGSGYDSHLLGNITINMSDNPYGSMDSPLFEGVRLDKLTFYDGTNSQENLGASELRRCWITSLFNGAQAGTDVTIDKCLIEDAYFKGKGNVVLRNSKIYGKGNVSDYMYNVTAINCNIDNEAYDRHSMS